MSRRLGNARLGDAPLADAPCFAGVGDCLVDLLGDCASARGFCASPMAQNSDPGAWASPLLTSVTFANPYHED